MFNLRRIAASTATAAAVVAAIGMAGASPASAAYSAVESCTGFSGKISYDPGLTSRARTQHAVLTGTLTGCSGINGAQAGTGSVTAVLTGTSKVGAVVETGTATVNWPVSSGLNPSNANLSVRQSAPDGTLVVSGTVTSGAFTSSILSTSLLPYASSGRGTSASPLKSQNVVNTLPFAAKVNFG